jgi:serine protein kinase
MGLLDSITGDFTTRLSDTTMSLEEYLELAKTDPSVYASPAQRMLKAIGEPVLVDTKNDVRLSKIFSNKVIKIYPAFKDFFGMEESIESIVSYFTHAAQGLEESKQILYLLGPVGGGKSSLAEKISELIENIPVYVVEGSPIFESPMGLFSPKEKYAAVLEKEYGIPGTAVRTIPSPWAIETLKELGGDVRKFRVRKMYPSRLRQECVARIEPGDENNQDISALVGELDIRQLEEYPQNHPFAYSFSGGLNRGNGGVVEMVEMFKTPIKMLHPLLTATQDRQYTGTKAIGRIPFDGIILAHSNESEWQQFKNNRTNEAFLDRVFIVKVPYCVRVDEEIEIYKKLLRNSELRDAPCAPGTLEFLAQFCVMSRIIEPQNSSLWSKMRVYNGENIKNEDPKAKPHQEYKDDAGVNEGMDGMSTRFAFKILSKTFNFDSYEVAANPIHLMYVLKKSIGEQEFDDAKEALLLDNLDGVLSDKYMQFLEKDITSSFLDSFTDLCQNIFENYFYWADAWTSDTDFRDPDTNTMFDREALNSELEKIEKPAGIASPKDFRNDVTNFVIRYKAANEGKLPKWNVFEKMRQVIEKKVVTNTEEILPVIAFSPKRSDDEKKKHEQFVTKMKERGYTERQTRYLCEWFQRARKSN